MKLMQFAALYKRSGDSARPGVRWAIWLLALAGAVALVRVSYSTVTASGSKPPAAVEVTAGLRQTSAMRFERAGNRRVNLSAGELVTAYEGSDEAVRILGRDEAAALAAASDDFDEDGVPDLVCAYAAPAGGVLTLHRGNVDSIYPNTSAAQQRRTQGKFTAAPFLSPARVFEARQSPEFVGAGDFDADDHRDLIAAQAGAVALWFYAGDGHGGFAAARPIVLPGAVTALEVGEMNRRDGLADIVVGVAGEAGAQALVFESPLGAINAEPEVFDLPAPAASLALGEIGGGYEQDLAIAAGNQLIIISGRDRKLSFDASLQPPVERPKVSSWSFDFNIKSLAIGDFKGDNHADIAMLGDDGRVRIGRNPAAASSKRRKTTPGAASLAAWPIKTLATEPWPMAAKLVRARVSSNPADSLLVLDSGSHRLHIIDQQPATANKTSGATAQAASADRSGVSSLVADGEVTAVLPMRLNGDALSDLVVLSRERSAPVVVHSVASTFTVNSTTDTSDAIPGNGVCNDGSGNCTLRAAIEEANASAGADMINFGIGSGAVTISLGFVLPQITETLTLDGTTQPGFAGSPLVEISGAGVSPGQDGFAIQADNCVVRGFVINRFAGLPNFGSGIDLLNSSNSIIEGNFIGTGVSGTGALANETGVMIAGGTGNTVGGTVAAARNLISGNNDAGVVIGSDANLVLGNFIGTDAAGGAALGNGQGGIRVGAVPNNTIGGTAAGARNLISGNAGDGVRFNNVGGVTGNLVQGNFIGTNATGNAPIPNDAGVFFNGSDITVGGTTPAAGNLISSNAGSGVQINTSATNNAVQGNFIGTNAAGLAALPNGENGVSVTDAPNNQIGGTAAGARNLISGNQLTGVVVFGATATGNTIQGNFVGTDVTGNSALPNANVGILINGAPNNTIGGTIAGAGNLISGHTVNFFSVGIEVQAGSSGTQIQGNLIGTNAAGTAAIPNNSGVFVISSNNAIGGASAAARNVISGNANIGVAIGGGGNRERHPGQLHRHRYNWHPEPRQ